MTTKTSALERELLGFTQIGSFIGYEMWKKGEERVLYNPKMRMICLRYTEGDDIYTLIKDLGEENENKNSCKRIKK